MNPNERQRIFWHLALLKVPGIGQTTARKLVEKFKEPREVFHCGREALEGMLPKNTLEALERYDPQKDESIEKELESIEKNDVAVITIFDEKYPRLLRDIFDAPYMIYVRGALSPQDELAVGIVGTRKPTRYGVETARRFAKYLVEQGITIVSGMAQGIDGNAQDAALESGGRTIAVLGSGVDIVYPGINRGLYGSIVERGAILSEFPMGTKPSPYNFPKRNRIISGLSRAVVVVEGKLDSGAMITANYAMDQGRGIFAVPGPIDRETSQGPIALIRSGATAVFEPSQIVEELGVPELSKELRRRALDIAESLTGSSKILFDIVGYEQKHIDEIAREAKLETQYALSALFELELRELVKRLPGTHFVRNI